MIAPWTYGKVTSVLINVDLRYEFWNTECGRNQNVENDAVEWRTDGIVYFTLVLVDDRIIDVGVVEICVHLNHLYG